MAKMRETVGGGVKRLERSDAGVKAGSSSIWSDSDIEAWTEEAATLNTKCQRGMQVGVMNYVTLVSYILMIRYQCEAAYTSLAPPCLESLMKMNPFPCLSQRVLYTCSVLQTERRLIIIIC